MVYIFYESKYIIIYNRMDKIIKEIPVGFSDYSKITEKSDENTNMFSISDDNLSKISGPRTTLYKTFSKEKPASVRKFNGILNDIKKKQAKSLELMTENKHIINNFNKKSIIGLVRELKSLIKDSKNYNKKKEILKELKKIIQIERGQIGGADLPTYEKPIHDFVEELKSNKMTEKKYENDPLVAEKIIEINYTDRFIFIGLTFAIRIISLFIVEWSLSVNIVNNFFYAIIAYSCFYILLFTFFVFLVNVIFYFPVTQLYKDYSIVDFPNMFYYMYVYTNGYVRLVLHISIILILLVIPFILDVESMEQDIKYDIKKKYEILTNISNFSFVIWILTSLIALKF